MEHSIVQPVGGEPESAPRPEIAFLLLDGLRTPQPSRRVMVLCALGLDRDGRAYPLAWRVVSRETDRDWLAVLRHLKARGAGTHLLLICCDGHPALLRTIPEVFPGIPVQISVAHRLLALSRMVERQWRAPCLAEARAIFAAPDPASAVARFREWRAHWAVQAYRAVTSLESDLAACLMFYRFSPLLWSKIRTVNLVERTFREIRRTATLPETSQESILQEPVQEALVHGEPIQGDPILQGPLLPEPVPPEPVPPEPAPPEPAPPEPLPLERAPAEPAEAEPVKTERPEPPVQSEETTGARPYDIAWPLPPPTRVPDRGDVIPPPPARRRPRGSRARLLGAVVLAVIAGLAAGLALAWLR